MTNGKVLTIQDISCYGQCSLTVALPIISACGVETVILPSAVLSTHTGGFTGYTFRDLTEDIPSIMNHWVKEGIKFDCLYTGYLGSITQIEYVKDLKKNVIKEDGLLIVDPACADNGTLYYGFNDEFVANMAKLCGMADIILPNLTEACFMTGMELRLENQDEAYIEEVIKKLAALGCKNIVLKGLAYKPGMIGVACCNCETMTTEYYFTKKIERNSHGTGDCYASAFTGALMHGRKMIDAAAVAAEFVSAAITATMDDDSHRYGVKFERALPMLVNELNR